MHLFTELNILNFLSQSRHFKLHGESLGVCDLLSPPIEHSVLFSELREFVISHRQHHNESMLLASSKTVALLLILLGLLITLVLIQNLHLSLNLNSALKHSLYREAHRLHLKSLKSKCLEHALATSRV